MNKKGRRPRGQARKSESPQAGYADVPSPGVAEEVWWGEFSDKLRTGSQASRLKHAALPTSLLQVNKALGGEEAARRERARPEKASTDLAVSQSTF